MAPLFGSHPQRVDEKGRFAVPARMVPAIRMLSGLSENDPVEVVISVTMSNRLGVFPKPVFERLVAEAQQAPAGNLDAEELLATYLNYMDEQELDKQNRIRIPSMHAELFDLNGEVVVMGSGEHLEIVNRNEWKEQAKRAIGRIRPNRARLRETAGKGEE